MTQNRIEVVNPASKDTSPTGTPVVAQYVVKTVTALVGVAAVGVATFPPHTIGFKVCAGVVAFGAFFGIVSPGYRR
jgi:hypothetical protein